MVDLTVRRATAADAAGIAHVVRLAWVAAYRRLMPGNPLHFTGGAHLRSQWARVLSDRSARPSIVLVAESSGEIVGVASGVPDQREIEGFEGLLHLLYVHPEHQRAGIGRRLLAGFAGLLAARDVHSLALWCLADNPRARAFYTQQGAVEIRREWEFWETQPFQKIAYGWTDFTRLR